MYSFWVFFVACVLHLTSALDTELSERIIGGRFVKDLKQCPYIGFLIRSQGGINLGACGATILSPKYILTAANCIKVCYCKEIVDIECNYCDYGIPEEFILYTGSDVIENSTEYGSFLNRWHIHPEFETYDKNHQCILHNDIAVGELKKELVFSDYINKVQLPPAIMKDQVNDTSVKTTQWAANNTQCKVLGWGNSKGGSYDKSPFQGRKLKSLKLNLISNELCLKYLFLSQKDFPVTTYYLENYGFCYNTGICTIDPVFKSDPCSGDSGGPLMCKGTQVGIISRGINENCVGIYNPNIYTRVDVYVPWINSIIGDQ